MHRVLVVDDDVASARTLQLHLRAQGYDTSIAHTADQGMAKARGYQPDLVVLDIRMPGRSGLEVLADFRALESSPEVIMITAFHDMDTTIQAMQRGAADYIHKPVDIDELDTAVERVLGGGPGQQVAASTDLDDDRIRMVGRSRAMKEIFKTIGLVARGNATVLVTGESGTGKELVARAIHQAGERSGGPFIAVNCAAVVDTLLESDMFGHEKGAFTGAVGKQPGKFGLADGGTIFLDEVGEMSPAMQAKLLRVLQTKEFTPLGAKAVQRTDARIIAATNVDLVERVAQGRFREDLYYRMCVVNIHVPPLRERPENLAELMQTLLERINQELGSAITQIEAEVFDCLARHQWPGNVRELENLLMKAVAPAPGNVLTVDLLPDELDCEKSAVRPNAGRNGMEALASLESMEKAHVERVLASTNWHRGKACEVLGISRPRLRRMIRHYNLHSPDGLDEEVD